MKFVIFVFLIMGSLITKALVHQSGKLNYSINLSNESLPRFNLIFKNTTNFNETLNEIPLGTDASFFNIAINRCINVKPNKICYVMIVPIKTIPPRVTPYKVAINTLNLSLTVSKTPIIISNIVSLENSNKLNNLFFSHNEQFKLIILNFKNNSNEIINPTILIENPQFTNIILNRCQSILPNKKCSFILALYPPLINSTMNYNLNMINNSIVIFSKSFSVSGEIFSDPYRITRSYEYNFILNNFKLKTSFGLETKTTSSGYMVSSIFEN